MAHQVDSEAVHEYSTGEWLTMQYKKRISCKEIVDLYPAHDPIYIEPKEKYGVENIRYREYNAAGSNWIKRPMPIHIHWYMTLYSKKQTWTGE
jgi:hypothetical protein